MSGWLPAMSIPSLLSTSDDFLGPEPLRTISDNQQLFTRGTAHLVLFDGAFEQTAGLAYTDYHRNIFDPNTIPAVVQLSITATGSRPIGPATSR